MNARTRACHLIGALGCACALAHASPNEIPIDTAGVAGFVPLVYGAHTLNAAIGSAGVEVDGYTFSALAGDRVSLVASTSGAGLDPVVTLRGPTGSVVASAACSGHNSFGQGILCATELLAQLPDTGTYTLNVADAGANNEGAYTLHLDPVPPVDNWVGFGYAAPVLYTVDHLGDSDFLAFNVKAGSGFRLTVASHSNGLDEHVQVWDTTGAQIQNTSCSGHNSFGQGILCTVLIDLNAGADGIYKVGVSDLGWNDLGEYEISVACLFGTCATGIPSPIPEPPAPWLWAGGLALVGWASQRRRTGVR